MFMTTLAYIATHFAVHYLGWTVVGLGFAALVVWYAWITTRDD